MPQGYIYVLANSSMPNLVKVGKTDRQPSLRAQELSRVTGVPTPFIVVYELFVDDSDAAEEFIHTYLEQKGYRVANNREFFSASVPEVISAFLSFPKSNQGHNETIGDGIREEVDELSSFDLSEYNFEPWRDLWEEGQNHEFGSDAHIQDYQEAMRCYKSAAKLGCIYSFTKLGDFYYYGTAVPKDDKKALDYYKEGTKKGNYGCYLSMAEVFFETSMLDNALKCISFFYRDSVIKKSPKLENEIAVPLMLARIWHHYCEDLHGSLPLDLQRRIANDKEIILESLHDLWEFVVNANRNYMIPAIRDAIISIEHMQ